MQPAAASKTEIESSLSAADYATLDAFHGEITRPKVSFFYKTGLLVVAATMILLPLIYLGLVGLAGYGVYWHATEHFGPIMNWGSEMRLKGRGTVFLWFLKLTCYGGPLFIGLVLVFFMIKPLFAGRAPHAQPYALNPGAEPLLFTFIDRICRLVGAPFPKRIDLDCDLNASAGFRRGLLSLFGSDLVLTIGLPVVPELLVPIKPKAVEVQHLVEQTQTVLTRYFFGLAPTLRPLSLAKSQLPVPINSKPVIESLKTIAPRIEAVRSQVEAACVRFADADARLIRAVQARGLLQAGYVLQPSAFQLSEATLAGVQQAFESAQAEQQDLAHKAAPVAIELRNRLATALGLLWTPHVASSLKETEDFKQQTEELLAVLPRLAELHAPLSELRREHAALSALLHNRSLGHPADELENAIHSISARAQHLLLSLQEKAAALPYPFPHPKKRVTVHDHATKGAYDPNYAEQVSDESGVRLERLFALHDGVVARLAQMAEMVERSV